VRPHNIKKQFITNLYQWGACGRGFSDTIAPIYIYLYEYQRW